MLYYSIAHSRGNITTGTKLGRFVVATATVTAQSHKLACGMLQIQPCR